VNISQPKLRSEKFDDDGDDDNDVDDDDNNNNNNNKLASEICAMWKQKAAQVIPTVISSTAVIPKSQSQNLTRLNQHPNKYTQLQKSVILGTCSIVRNFLNYK